MHEAIVWDLNANCYRHFKIGYFTHGILEYVSFSENQQ